MPVMLTVGQYQQILKRKDFQEYMKQQSCSKLTAVFKYIETRKIRGKRS